LTIAQAREHRLAIEWKASDIAVPSFLGDRALDSYPLDEIAGFIDWTPFFHAWELRGRYPHVLQDPQAGPKARELFDDARQLLDRIIAQELLTARATYGFFLANSVCDDIEVYADGDRSEVLTVFHTLRQQAAKAAGEFNLALADFIAPRSTGITDYIGAFAVTTGHGVEELCRGFERDHDDYSSIMTKALADRLVEAFAELLHKKVRDECGYGSTENLGLDDLIHEKYRGIRPAPGYPACPDHTEKRLLFDLLRVEQHTGIRLTENYAMMPASSVSGLYFAHPQSRYFAVGKIGRDQAIDYANRKHMSVQAVERWLSPNLA
jgi:5-methyltetrahydrofolate--homocysteine methyltransferase